MTDPATPPPDLDLGSGTYNWLASARVERKRVVIHLCDDEYVDEPNPAELNPAQCRVLAGWLTQAADYIEAIPEAVIYDTDGTILDSAMSWSAWRKMKGEKP